jgi:hypothetical protein
VIEMIKYKARGAIFTAILLLSLAFVPAVMAEPTTTSMEKSNAQAIIQSGTGTVGENLCDALTAALWALDQVVNDSRIAKAENVLSEGATHFRNNQISAGCTDLLSGVRISTALLSYWGSHLASWLYNKLLDAINAAKSYLHQQGYL